VLMLVLMVVLPDCCVIVETIGDISGDCVVVVVDYLRLFPLLVTVLMTVMVIVDDDGVDGR